MDFIKADSNCFTLNGRRLDLRGLGIGTWLNLEHFMVGLPTPDEMIRTAFQNTYGPAVSECFFKKYVNSFIDDADFAFLKKAGLIFCAYLSTTAYLLMTTDQVHSGNMVLHVLMNYSGLGENTAYI